MAIQMRPDQFPEHRREDLRRDAEARVYDALRALELNGRAIYELRFRRGGLQVDFALWVDGLGRFAIQVKGGEYLLDREGRWSLRAPDGGLAPVPSPLDETVDGCIEVRQAIRQATGYTHFLAGVLVFPDMGPSRDMERAAEVEEHVYIVWGVDRLQEELERIAELVKFRRPPRAKHSENEARQVNGLRYRDGDGGTEARGGDLAPGGDATPGEDGERQYVVGNATFNIQHLEKLVVQHFHLERDSEGKPVLPQP